MNKLIKYILLIFLMGEICTGSNAFADLRTNGCEYMLKYSLNDLCLEKVEQDHVTYTQISLKELQNTGEIGQPSLPVQPLYFSIPANADNLSISTQINDKETILIEECPLPEQEPALSNSKSEDTKFIHLSQDLTSIITPSEISASIHSISILGGCHRLVAIDINPIVWNLNMSSLDFATDIKISLTWDLNPGMSEKLTIPKFEETIEHSISKIQKFVVNPDDVRGNMPDVSNGRQFDEGKDFEMIPYIIVTTKELSSSLERLAALRRLRGIPTQVRCIEDILSNSKYIAKAQEDEYKDDASILRAFVADAYYTLGTEYILLAGPYPTIPGRWAQVDQSAGPHDCYVSDFYYRNVDSYWPKKSDRYPVPDELNNFENYINVGRIPCSTSTEIDNYIDKLIQYEFNIGNVDLSYLNNAFVLLGDDSKIKDKYYEYSDELYNEHFSFLKIDSNALTRTYKGAEAVESMNSNFWGYVDWRCHGHFAGLATNNPTYGINAEDRLKGAFGAEEDNNGLDNWNNYLHPCWTISMSCNLSELRSEYFGIYNVAQSFILGKNYGGIAFIANSGPGYINSSSSLSKKIFQSCIEKTNSYCNIPYSSSILNDGLDKINKTDWYNRYLITTIGLTGDPLVPLWLKEPYKINWTGEFYPHIINNSEKVVYGKNYFNNSPSQTGEGTITEYKNIHETTNYTLLNYRSDFLPYIHPCNISGLSINKSGYWFTGKTSFKNDRNNDKKSLTLLNNSSITFECLDEMEMTGGIDIAAGCSMVVKVNGDISINNCKIEGNGNLIINYNTPVTVGKNTAFSKGMCISIK